MEDGRYKRKRVLEDDEYDATLDMIVEKTFFPGMDRLREQGRYLDAMQRGDTHEMARIKGAYAEMTPSRVCETPATHPSGNTPRPENLPHQELSAPTVIIGRRQQQQPDGLPSLDQFLRENTAEEDASFSMLRDTDLAEHRRKWAWCYREQGSVPQIADKPATGGLLEASKTKGHDTKSQALVPSAAGTVSAAVSGAATLQRNPEGSLMTVARSGDAVQAPPSVGPPKTLNLKALRGYREEMPPPPKAKPAGRGPSVASSEMSEGDRHSLLATPVITPGGGTTPLMTWGQLDGTPLVLAADHDEAEAIGRKFHMQEEDAREKAAKRLSAQAAKRMKESKLGTATAANTPLHAKLMAKAGLTPRRGAGEPLTPSASALLTPSRTDIFSKVRTPSTAQRLASLAPSSAPTPKRVKRSAKGSSTPRNVTDGLLKL